MYYPQVGMGPEGIAYGAIKICRIRARPEFESEEQGAAHATARPLTGLFEQDYLGQQVEKTLLRCRQGPLEATLALLQLENFYEIRSWVGKSEASLLLSDIARLLEKSLPDKAVLCHCEHYEFAVLLLDECSLNARLITDRVKLAMQSTVSASIPPQLELKCGIGLAKLSRRIPSADVVFARARHDLGLGHHRGDIPDATDSSRDRSTASTPCLEGKSIEIVISGDCLP